MAIRSYDMRDGAMMDVLDARKGLMTKIQNKTLSTFNMKFRSKKQPSRTIRLFHKHYKKKGVFFPQYFGKEPFRSSEPLPDKLEYDSMLQLTWLNELYLVVPRPKQPRS